MLVDLAPAQVGVGGNARHSPWVDDEGDEVLVLYVDVANQEVERSLGCTVRRDGVRDVLGGADGADDRRDGHELGVVALLEERKNGLEETDDAGGVDVDVLEEVSGVQLGDADERRDLEDARVGDDDIELGDPLGDQALDSGLGVRVGGALDLDDDQLAARSLGQVVELLRLGRCRVADRGDDGGVRARQVLGDEALADA